MNAVEHAYVSAHAKALELLASISQAIEDQPAPGTAKINWSHVGSLAHLNQVLADTLEFISGEVR